MVKTHFVSKSKIINMALSSAGSEEERKCPTSFNPDKIMSTLFSEVTVADANLGTKDAACKDTDCDEEAILMEQLRGHLAKIEKRSAN